MARDAAAAIACDMEENGTEDDARWMEESTGARRNTCYGDGSPAGLDGTPLLENPVRCDRRLQILPTFHRLCLRQRFPNPRFEHRKSGKADWTVAPVRHIDVDYLTGLPVRFHSSTMGCPLEDSSMGIPWR